MSKQGQSFQQVYQKTTKFYDFQYHLHKSTFKGLGNWMKQYSQIEKNYAEKLFSMSKNIPEHIADHEQQVPAIAHSLADLTQCISTYSQLHHNYSQRLSEVSFYLLTEYNNSKRLKQKHMKILKDLSEEKIQKARESRNRDEIGQCQMQTSRKLFEHLDTYAEEQLGRIQKVKQQLLIFLSLTKKIQQKHLETSTKFKSKITQEEIELKSTQLDRVSQMLANFYNTNINRVNDNNIAMIDPQTKKLVTRNFQNMKKVQVLRESLKESTLFREKVGRMDTFKHRITLSLKDYQRLPESLPQYHLIMKQHRIQGLFNHNILKQVKRYSNLIKTIHIKRLAYSMLNTYYQNFKNSGEIRALLLTIKANIKLKGQIKNQSKSKSIGQFIGKEMNSQKSNGNDDMIRSQQNKEYQFHVGFMLILSKIYLDSQQESDIKRIGNVKNVTQSDLLNYIMSQDIKFLLPELKSSFRMHSIISHVVVKTLLQSIITIEDDDSPMLTDSFADIVQVVEKFAQQWLDLDRKLVRLIAVEIIQSNMKCVKGKFVEQVHLLVEGSLNGNSNINNRNRNTKSSQASSNTSSFNLEPFIISKILTSLTPAIISFYTLPIPLINYFCILICIQKLSILEQFSAVEYFHKCIKRAGHSYIFWIDEEKKMIEPMIWQGEMRLKNMVEILQQLEYKKLQETHFLPTAEVMSPILGVDQRIILQKLKQQLLLPLGDIIQENLSLLQNQQGADKQGYILKLGVLIAQMDIGEYRAGEFTNKYFRVLEMYLNNTQVEYNTLLEHSRKTELWIIEENAMATPNCVDFCSLLYKPFEFLLKTIKLIAQQNKTMFTTQFSEFIKNKLNNILKEQIVKYINFLYDSLWQYNNKASEQQQIHYKQNKLSAPSQITQEYFHMIKMTFMQSTKRVYNLNFLKSQLNEIMNDFLEEYILEDLDHDVFCLDKLAQATGKYRQHKEILCNLKDIVETISRVEEKLIIRVSEVTVFNCMRQLFANLYYQQEKSAFEQFFSTKQDYTFSKYTFVYYQKQFQDIFTMIQKHLPQEIEQKYYPKLMENFHIAIKCELLNTAKFKLPKSKDDLVKFVDDDCSFIANTIKHTFLHSQIVQTFLQKPLKDTLLTLKASTKDLIHKFETQTLSNNNQQCKSILVILYMRTNDQKAQQFFKKFKSTIFKRSLKIPSHDG